MINNQNTYNHQPMSGGLSQGMGGQKQARRKPFGIINKMVDYRFPSWLSTNAIVTYILALVVISMVFNTYAMQWYWWVFGVVGVLGFFLGTNYYSREWGRLGERAFKKKTLVTALIIRVVVVIVLYWFFDAMTGKPFMFNTADEEFYDEMGRWLSRSLNGNELKDFTEWTTENLGISDSGFPYYVGFLYYLTDDSVIVVRLLNALWSASTCILVYKLGKRNFGENAGRLAAIFLMLEPHYIIYCGLHLKETLMIFLLVFFLERADNLLRSRRFKFLEVLPTFLLLLSVFTFRTALGIALTLAVVLALILSSKKVANLGRRWLLLILFVFGAGIFVGGRIASEIEFMWQNKDSNQEKRMTTIQSTQTLAKYASKTVFAPMIFTIPFPTMVETEGQDNHRMLHAGNVVKNIMSFFCVVALVLLIMNSGFLGWRNNVLLGAFMIIYLLILIQSAFVHADRFHLPVYVVELIFSAFGVTQMTKAKHKRWYMFWCVLMFIAWIGWAYFKLQGRGMI